MLNQITSNSKIYDFNNGRDEIIRRVEQCISKPILIAVFGVPDSGKTHLIDFIGKYFEDRGLKTRQRDNKEKINWYESWTEKYYFNGERIKEELSSHDLIMYHCSWDDRAKPWEHNLDPEETIKKVINRDLDLSVGIYNPKRRSQSKGLYDLIISNPASWEKPYNFDD